MGSIAESVETAVEEAKKGPYGEVLSEVMLSENIEELRAIAIAIAALLKLDET